MQYWKQRSPFLEKDVDHLIGDESRRGLPDIYRLRHCTKALLAAGEKGSCVDVCGRPAGLLYLLLEGI